MSKKGFALITETEPLRTSQIDVRYDVEAFEARVADLREQLERKCAVIMAEARMHTASLRTLLHVEMCKIPTQVQKMSLRRFRDEFGEDPEAFGRAFLHRAVQQAYDKTGAPRPRSKTAASDDNTFQTPSRFNPFEPKTSGTSVRLPRQGETIFSNNNSPLGEFTGDTVRKALREPSIGSTCSFSGETSINIKINSRGELELNTADEVPEGLFEALKAVMRDYGASEPSK